MADATGEGSTAVPPAPTQARPARGPWASWVLFGACVLVLVGAANVIVALAALVRGDLFVTAPARLFVFDLDGWGWVHLVLGVLALLAGAGLFTANAAARVVAIVLAQVNALAQLAFLPAYPAWSVVVIALDVVVLWAVAVHGDEVREPRPGRARQR